MSAQQNALRRSAVAMLKVLGGGEAVLRTASPIEGSGDPALGLAQYEISEVRLSPALLRDVDTDFELLVAELTLEETFGRDREVIRQVLKDSLGVRWGNRSFAIESVEWDQFAGCEYLCRLKVRENDAGR